MLTYPTSRSPALTLTLPPLGGPHPGAVYVGPRNVHPTLLPRTVDVSGLRTNDTLGHAYIKGSTSQLREL